MASLFVWLFIIPAVGLVVLLVVLVGYLLLRRRDRRLDDEARIPPTVSEDGRFYWDGRRWRPLR